MSEIFDITNIILLVLAVVIFLRLRSVLGRKTGAERPPVLPRERAATPASEGGDNVIQLPRANDTGEPREEAPAPSALDRALAAIVSADRTFDREYFLVGAKAAYEMIVVAFAQGDRKALKSLLSREVFDSFSAALDERARTGQTVETQFVGVDKAEITEAAMRDRTARVTVRFFSKMITATRDKDGNVIDGDPTRVSELVDEWTFERQVNASDPNWLLVATEAPE